MDNYNFENDNFPPDLYNCVHKFPQIMENDEMYLSDKYFIEKYGEITVNEAKVYTPELYYVLMYGRLQRYDYDKNTTVIDTIAFYHCYIDAFKSEKQSFDNKNANRQQPKNSVEYDFYINYLKGKLDKCKIIFQNPDIITYHLCEKYGRLAGLFSRIIEIIGDDLNLQQRIKEIANNNTILLQRIIKLRPDISLQQLNEPAPKPIQLIKSLSENQQTYLYNKLIENSLFLPTETDFNSFCFVFGNSIKPDDFKALQWLQNRQLLRELITELKHPDIEITKNKYTLPAFFIDKKNDSIIELPTNTKIDTNFRDILLKTIRILRQTK